jgi:hypothetical protein
MSEETLNIGTAAALVALVGFRSFAFSTAETTAGRIAQGIVDAALATCCVVAGVNIGVDILTTAIVNSEGVQP